MSKCESALAERLGPLEGSCPLAPVDSRAQPGVVIKLGIGPESRQPCALLRSRDNEGIYL